MLAVFLESCQLNGHGNVEAGDARQGAQSTRTQRTTQSTVAASHDASSNLRGAPRDSGLGPSALDRGFRVAGYRIRLTEANGKCRLDHARGEQPAVELDLDMRPPCFVMTWRQPPIEPIVESGKASGVPVGTQGDPMAWRYPTAGNAVVIAFVGDPVGEIVNLTQRQREWIDRGWHCGKMTRGVLFLDDEVRLSREYFAGGVRCVESGMDELQFNILAHDSRASP